MSQLAGRTGVWIRIQTDYISSLPCLLFAVAFNQHSVEREKEVWGEKINNEADFKIMSKKELWVGY
jgi:hypothetical protein